MVKISPSMLASNFSKLGSEVRAVEEAGADMVHLDVMDGNFVPNITFGAGVIKSLRGLTKLRFDVHLMISEPLRYIRDFAEAGADIITIHVESGSRIEETIAAIRERGITAGLSVKPGTPVETVLPYLDELELVLIMTVEPGFGGQKFMPEMLRKAAFLREEIERRGSTVGISVDGGINADTAGAALAAGADILVAGSAIFGAGDYRRAIEDLRFG